MKKKKNVESRTGKKNTKNGIAVFKSLPPVRLLYPSRTCRAVQYISEAKRKLTAHTRAHSPAYDILKYYWNLDVLFSFILPLKRLPMELRATRVKTITENVRVVKGRMEGNKIKEEL